MAIVRKRRKMKRTQISLMPEEYAKIRRMADARGVSLSQAVRDMVNAAPEPESATSRDPMLALIGMVKNAGPDDARRHDEIIYGESVR